MKLGWCGPIENAAIIAKAGLDFIEVPLAPFGLESELSLRLFPEALDLSPWVVPAPMMVMRSAFVILILFPLWRAPWPPLQARDARLPRARVRVLNGPSVPRELRGYPTACAA
jgi:hypothetical protein